MDWIRRLNQGPQFIMLGGRKVEILNWSYAPHLPDNRLHRHTHFEICQVGAYGQGRFLVEGRPHDLNPWDLFIARPGITHQIINTTSPNMELFWVSFVWLPEADRPVNEIDALLSSFANSQKLVVRDEEGRISILWRALRVIVQGDLRLGTEEQLKGLMASLLLAIAQAGSELKSPQIEEPTGMEPSAAKVRLAVRYVYDNLHRRLPVSEISSQLNLSPRHLARLFARHLGVSPASYIEQARLDQAKTLLQNTSTPIKGIANTVGYESIHHFSRAFSRRFGLPPGVFREADLKDVSKSQKRGG